MNYKPPLGDIRFILHDVLDAGPTLRALSPFSDTDDALMQQVLEEAGKFVASEVAPLNRVGDETGCRFDLHEGRGQVTTPPGFRQAYQDFWQAGWPALAVAPEDGGQGLPWVLEGALYEMLSAANHGWTMAPGLLHGAYECLKHHGSEALRQAWLPKIASGEWLATMCLTEPHAGSDLGLVRTRGEPPVDGGPAGDHRVSGTKIFISGGEHDLTDNIVHLVLGRLPDAPPGPKGLSLFLVPKVLANGARNAVFCERIEEKMGLHGSPTCVLRFDGATGWLIGEAGRGLNAMFVMMNAARLHVALQGIGLLDAAWQKADAYSRERRQMRAPRAAAQSPASGPDFIAEHPAMRRLLDTQRAWIDGGRVLAYRTGIELDVAKHHTDPKRRAAAQNWCSLITPVLKAAFTNQAFHGASECLQVFGGHGYVREWGIEQVVRDARVPMIYEGTNEIQAIDLLVRKVLADGGAGMGALLVGMRADMDASRDTDAAVLRRFAELRYLTATLVEAAKANAALPYELADDYLRTVALALLSWAWARIDATPGTEDARWRLPAAQLQSRVLPEFGMLVAQLQLRCKAVLTPHPSVPLPSPG
jgi:alkylation response protein AidB-like acyl-CoA dehydrogenase